MALERIIKLRSVKRYRLERYVLISPAVVYRDTIKVLVGIAVQYLLLAAVPARRQIYLEKEAGEAAQAEAGAENAFAAALRRAAADGCVVARMGS